MRFLSNRAKTKPRYNPFLQTQRSSLKRAKSLKFQRLNKPKKFLARGANNLAYAKKQPTKKDLEKNLYIEKKIERKPIKKYDESNDLKEHRDIHFIREYSDYTKTTHPHETSDNMINDDDTEFERYFGFKIGEEVDIAAQLGYRPKIKAKEKHKRKHTSDMNFEEKIAHTKHNNPKIKAPTMAKNAAKPPIP